MIFFIREELECESSALNQETAKILKVDVRTVIREEVDHLVGQVIVYLPFLSYIKRQPVPKEI